MFIFLTNTRKKVVGLVQRVSRRSRTYTTSARLHPSEQLFESIEKCEERLVMSAIPLIDWSLHVEQNDLACNTVAVNFPVDNGMINQVLSQEQVDIYGPNYGSVSAAPPLEINTAVNLSQVSAAHQQTGWDDVQRLYGLQGAGQTIAVIDTGIAWDHVALGGGFGPNYRVVGGYDFAENDSRPYDDGPAGFHGTHVAGIIGSDDATRTGVAPQADLVALRVFDDYGKGQLAWTESALRWVHQNKNTFEFPITTVNLSLGATWNGSTVPDWATLEDEFQLLQQDGIVVVASAGNSFSTYNTPGLAYPAASPYVIPVASTDANGDLSSFSQRLDRVIAAPGRSILSTVPDHVLGADGIYNDWSLASGTSMAAPYVTGASALIREAMEIAGWTSITPQGIYHWLQDTASSVWDSATNQAYDRLDLFNAISKLFPTDDVGSDWNSASTVQLQNSFQTNSWINTIGDSDAYRFTATSDGTVTIAEHNTSLAHSSWTLWTDGQQTQTNQSSDLSFQVQAGKTYAIGISDASSFGKYSLDWSFASNAIDAGSNPVPTDGTQLTRDGASLSLIGTDGTDRVTIDISNGLTIDYGNNHFQYPAGAIANLSIDLGFGSNQLTIIGSSDSEKVDSHSGEISIENQKIKIHSINTQDSRFSGGGGSDRVYAFGSVGDDTLTASPRSIEWVGSGFKFKADNVERTYIDATQGGQDVAYFFDSVGDDRLSVRPQFSSIAGSNFFNYASGIERVYAYSNAGGNDTATLYDSVGNDTFNTNGDIASIAGPNFFSYTRYFENVEAISSAGGRDIASVYASSQNSLLVASDFTGYQDSSWSRIARGFSTANTYVANSLIQTRSFGIQSVDDQSFDIESLAVESPVAQLPLTVETPAQFASTINSDSFAMPSIPIVRTADDAFNILDLIVQNLSSVDPLTNLQISEISSDLVRLDESEIDWASSLIDEDQERLLLASVFSDHGTF